MTSDKLILGTVQFGLDYGINNGLGKPSDEEIKGILDFAFENGIDFLDTAEAYGDSQERIGQYHSKSENKFKIITKYSSATDSLSSDIRIRINENMAKLKVDNLYSYMFHSFNDFKSHFHEFRDELISLKNDKLIEKLGVSVYTNEELEEVLEHEEIDLIQIPYNLFDNNNLRGEVLSKAKKNKIEIHTRSAFLQGLFFTGKDNLRENLQPLKAPLDLVETLSEQNNISISDLALHYACSNQLINKVLIGVDSLNQLKENVNSVRKEIDQNVFKEINKIEIGAKELLNPSNW